MKPSRLALSVLCLVAACKTHISADLSTRALTDAADGAAQSAVMVFAQEMANEEECPGNGRVLAHSYSLQYPGARFTGCSKIEYDTVALVEVQAPVMVYAGAPPVPDVAVAIGLTQTGEGYLVSFLTDPDKSREIWASLPPEMTQFQSYESDTALRATLLNDRPQHADAILSHVFAGENPVIGPETVTLAPGESVDIVLSDVANSAFGETATAVPILLLKPAE
jgi:hypothetical protein